MVFRAEPEMVAALNLAGIDIVSTANNHARDCGGYGIEFTLELLGEERHSLHRHRRQPDARMKASSSRAKAWASAFSATLSTNPTATTPTTMIAWP